VGPEIDWIPGILASIAGLILGGVIATLARRGPEGETDAQHTGRTRAEARNIRIEDLTQRKAQLIQQIRDLEDTALAGGLSEAPAERATLEEEAAKVLRELHHLGTKAAEPPPGNPVNGTAAVPSSSAGGGLTPQLKGALTGGAFVGMVALLLFGLQSGTSERKGNMPMTGGDVVAEQTSDLPPPGAGRPGEAVPGVPPALQPKNSPALDAARAAVASDPSNVEKRAVLGWALVDAEGWIDVFNNAAQLVKLDPDNPDALTQQAVVRVRMGQQALAEQLLDTALTRDGKHGRALAWKGSLRWQAGDTAGAKEVWTKGESLYPAEGFTELLRMADNQVQPNPGRGPSAAGETSQPATAEASQPAARPAPIQGHITVPAGTSIPPEAVIFVYARPAGQTAGPPLAAVRLRPAVGKVPFSIGPDDMPPMMGKRPFPDSVTLAARLDLDGNAGTKEGPSGSLSDPVAAGSAGVAITLRP